VSVDPKRDMDDPVNLPEDADAVLGELLSIEPDDDATEDKDEGD
jgi:hypothetical protein